MAEDKQPKNADTLKEKLQNQLSKVQQRLANAKQEIESMSAKDKEAIRQKASEIRERIKQDQEDAKKRRGDISAWLEARKQHTDEQVASWRQKREIKHLEKRAARAEEYAVNAVVVAIADADEAEAAVLDAIDARLDADAATP